MNKIIFIGGIYPECEIENIINRYGCLPQAAADALQKSIISGLESNIQSHITVFNSYFLPLSFTCFEKEKAYSWNGNYGENYNLSFIKNRILAFNSKKRAVVNAVSKWLDENIEQGETVDVIVYPAYFAFMKAVAKLKQNYKLNVCLAVPDLPKFMGLNKNTNLYHKLTAYVSQKSFEKNLRYIDSFVLLTEQMNEKINVYKKPYCVIEGIIPTDYVYEGNTENRTVKNIVYSGTLKLKYGIEELLEATEYIKNEDVNFLFYGNGEAVNLIEQYAKSDSRIIFKGSVSPKSLRKVHQNADILVNPRPGGEEFVKYSFPSKLLEYMMSGTPTVAHLLEGIPSEYADYIFIPENYSSKSLAKKINEVLNMSVDDRIKIGQKARDFVLENKNPKKQTEKIIDLLYKK